MRHKAGSCTAGVGSVSCDERIRNRRGIAVACMPSASMFRSIRPANSSRLLLAVSPKWLLPFFAVVVDTVIYDFLPSFLHHRKECRIRQVFSRFRLPPQTLTPVHYARA